MRIAILVKWAIVSIAVLYLALMTAMYLGQRRLLYNADPTRIPPASVGFSRVTEQFVDTPDGEKILIWRVPAEPGQPTILWYHGQGDTLANLRGMLRRYVNKGRGFVMMAYRGYSGSTGSPNETNNVADARLILDTLVKDGIKPQDIILYGQSLGTGVALQVAAERKVGGVILDSPFTSVADRAAELYWWLPVHRLILDPYESSRHITRLHAPLFILHGEADAVVPVAMGRKMFALANEPKEIVTLPGAGHNDHENFGSFEAIDGWITRLRSGAVKR